MTASADLGSPENFAREQIRAVQWERLSRLLDEAWATNAFYQRFWNEAGLTPADIASLDDLSRLPLLTKSRLASDQWDHPPYGTNLTRPLAEYVRLHQTSGTTTGQPLRWLDTPRNWSWALECWSQSYRLMELRPDDRLCFPFSFGPFLGFWAGFEGALQQGRLCIAAGGLSSEARLQLIADHSITILGCTPSYALRLAEVGASKGIDLAAGSVRLILVAGEPGGSIPATRQRIETAWGARVIDHWGMTELGPLATESYGNPGELSLLETECIAEVLDPATLAPVAAGEVGELVITNLGRIDSPVIRYRTGDLVKPVTTPDARGRQLLRFAGGVLGRADDMLIIRGNNVFPSSIEAIVRQFPEVAEFRLIVGRHREMATLRVEVEPLPNQSTQLLERIQAAFASRFGFQMDLALVEPGSLPRFEMKARRLVRES